MMDDLPPIKYVRPADFGFGWLPGRRGPTWRLLEDYQFGVQMPDGSLRMYWIPEGFEFDKASIPPLFWWPPLCMTPEGPWTLPALEHDWLCCLLHGGNDWVRETLLGQVPEAPPAWVVHHHFQQRCLDHVAYAPGEDGMRLRQALLLGNVVKALGPQGWAWPWVRLFVYLALAWALYPYLPLFL